MKKPPPLEFPEKSLFPTTSPRNLFNVLETELKMKEKMIFVK